MKEVYRADTVGSLLRPESVHAARRRYAAGAIDAAALRAVEDAAIRDVVRMQEEIGLRVVTDGEFRRENWWIDFVARLRGVRITEGDPLPVGADGHDRGYVPKKVLIEGRVEAEPGLLAADFAFVRGLTDRVAKITIPSPTRLHFHGGRGVVSQAAYPDIEAFFADVAGVYRRELTALEAAGCRYVQIDDPLLTYFLSPRMRDGVRAEGDDPDARLARYVRWINECIAGRGPELCVGIHLCRGNARGISLSEGPYDAIAEACFGGLAVDRFLLEYDDVRSGGFAPLRFVPAGKQVVLGLVTTKHPALERKDAVKRRIDEAAWFVDGSMLAVSPQCGFASVAEGNEVTLADQVAKLRLVVEVAREVWGA